MAAALREAKRIDRMYMHLETSQRLQERPALGKLDETSASIPSPPGPAFQGLSVWLLVLWPPASLVVFPLGVTCLVL